MAYILYTDVQDFLGIDLQVTGQTTVNAIIPAVEAFMESACNRKWALSGSLTETFDSNQTTFFVQAPPIASVVSLVVDGVTQIASTDYFTYNSFVRMTYKAVNKPRTVVLTYASAASLPADVKHAMVRWASQIFKEAKDAGKPVARVNMGPMAVEFLTKDGVPAFVEEVIARHRLASI